MTQDPMHTKPTADIANSELKAVREFLTSIREEGPHLRTTRPHTEQAGVPLRNGIARARMRSVAKPQP